MPDIDSLLPPLGFSEKEQRNVPRVINRLLGDTFLYQDIESDKEDYYFVHRNRAAIETLLALSGFTLMHDDYHRIFQVISDYSYCRAHYKLDESLMIVVLRKLYEERMEHLSLAQDPTVTIGEVREEYRAISGKERDLGIVQYETLLRRLRAIGLIDTVEGRTIDVRATDSRLRLRGSIRLILPIKTVDEMDAWLRKYRKASEEGQESNEEDTIES